MTVKTNGYAHTSANADVTRRRVEAAQRQARRDGLSTAQQLHHLDLRPGGSERERARLAGA